MVLKIFCFVLVLDLFGRIKSTDTDPDSSEKVRRVPYLFEFFETLVLVFLISPKWSWNEGERKTSHREVI